MQEITHFNSFQFHSKFAVNRPVGYSAKEPGSSDVFKHFCMIGSIELEWRLSLERPAAFQ